jgi:hypothetical protein
VATKVIEGTYSVLNEAEKILSAPQDWSDIHLSREEQILFATAAHLLRFGNASGDTRTPIKPQQLLIPRRQTDMAGDLWTTFNKVQENVVRGGLRGVRRDETGRSRRVRSRAINGIDQHIRLNQALWTLSQHMANLKA